MKVCRRGRVAEPLCTGSSAERAASVTSSTTSWRGIVLAPGERSELHCSAHAITSWCCSSERRATQHCNCRCWIGSDYTQASVPVP